MENIFRKLLEDKVVNESALSYLRNNPQFSLADVLKNLGVSSERISYYLSFQETQSEQMNITESKKEFAGYEIVEKIARGGMGIVYKAKDLSGRVVALKILLADMLQNPTQKKRFYREAETTASLNHPHIVPVYTMKEHGRFPYLTMKYVEGTTLQDYIDSDDFSLDTGLEILRKIAEALAYAHKKKIIHRDLKPSNILLDVHGEPYLTDFGLARFTDKRSDLTHTETKLGTPFYMAPEQITGSVRHVNAQSDIYSLGVILYQMLTSQLPFQGSTLQELYHNITRGYPKSPDRKKHGELVDICYKSIALKPSERYQMASKMASDILCYQEGKKGQIAKTSIFFHFKIYRKLYSRFCYSFLLLTIFSLVYCLWPKAKKTQKTALSSSQIWKLAKREFDSKKYEASLMHIRDLLSMKANHRMAARLQIRIMEKLDRKEGMRLAWIELFKMSNLPSDLEFIAQNSYKHGFLRQSLNFWKKLIEKNPRGKYLSKLASCLFLLGEYEKAAEIYSKLSYKTSEDYINMAYIDFYLQDDKKIMQDDRNILKWLKKAKTENVFLKQRIAFLQNILTWERLDDLMQRDWLSQQKTERTKKLQRELGKIENSLQKISQQMKKYQAKTYHEKIFRQKIQYFQKAIAIEIGKENLNPKWEQSLQRIDFPIRLQIFFRKLIARYWIYQKNWPKVIDISSADIYKFPWVSTLYQLRAFACAHQKELFQAISDTLRASKLDDSNITAMSNTSDVVLDHMSQFEFYSIIEMLMCYEIQNVQSIHYFYRRIFAFYQRKLRQKCQNVKIQSKKANWKKLINVALISKSKQTRMLIGKMLSFQNQEAIFYLKEIEKKSREKKENVQEILSVLDAQKRNFEKQKIRQALIRHSALSEDLYALEIFKMGGLKTLLDILKDSNEPKLLRLLAAQMLINLCDHQAFKELLQVANGENFPENLLAKFALNQKGIPCHLSEKHISTIEKSDLFYRLLYTFLAKRARHLRKLLRDPHPLVIASAAFHLRKWFSKKSIFQETNQKLLRLMKNRDPLIRSIALYAFWKYEEKPKIKDIGDEKWELQKFQNVFRFFEALFPRYSYTLIRGMKDKSLEVKFTALSALLANYKCLVVSYRLNPKVDFFPILKSVLKKMYQKGEFKHQVALGLNSVSKIQEMQYILNNQSTLWFVRFLILRYSLLNFTQMDNVMRVVHFFKRSTINSPRNPEERKLKQVNIIFVMLAFQKHFIFSNFFKDKMLRENIKSRNIHIRRATAVAFSLAQKKYISLLKPLLQSNDLYMRSSVAGSLLSLKQKYQTKDLKKFNQIFQKSEKTIRKNIAWEYYKYGKKFFAIKKNFRNIFYGHESLTYNWEKRYDFDIKEANWDLKRLNYLKSAIEIFPFSRFFYEAAQTLYHAGKMKESEKYLWKGLVFAEKEKNKIKKISYKKSRFYGLLAKIFLKRKKYKKARLYLHKALECNPFQYQYHMALAQCYNLYKQTRKSWKHYYCAYLCQPRTEHQRLVELWNSPKHRYLLRRRKKLVHPKRGYLLFGLALWYLKNNSKNECIDILKLVENTVRLNRNFFAKGAFKELYHHPWIKTLPSK